MDGVGMWWAEPLSIEWTDRRTIKSILAGIGSQCRILRTGVIWGQDACSIYVKETCTSVQALNICLKTRNILIHSGESVTTIKVVYKGSILSRPEQGLFQFPNFTKFSIRWGSISVNHWDSVAFISYHTSSSCVVVIVVGGPLIIQSNSCWLPYQ